MRSYYVTATERDAFIAAIESGDEAAVRRVVEAATSSADASHTFNIGGTESFPFRDRLNVGDALTTINTVPFEWACHLGHLPIVRYLKEKGFHTGNNALHRAAQAGHLEMMRFLRTYFSAEAVSNYSSFIPVDGIGGNGPAMRFAIVGDKPTAIRCLLEEFGVNILQPATPPQLESLLEFATRLGRADCVREILRSYQANYADRHKPTLANAFTQALQTGSEATIRAFVETMTPRSRLEEIRITVFATTLSPMSFVAAKRDVALTQYFMEQGFPFQERALYWASWFGNLPVVQHLIQARHIDVNAEITYPSGQCLGGAQRSTALAEAAAGGHLSLISFLLKEG